MSGLRVLVCGGRDYNDRTSVYEALNTIVIDRGPIDVIIHGDASGADRLAGDWARAHGVTEIRVPADWANIDVPGAVVRSRRDGTKYNAAAGPMRNQRMLDQHGPDLVLAFPGGSGTGDMMTRAYAAGVEVVLWED